MTTTIIFTHGGGRFANQLLLFGHFIGLLEEHPELRLINMSFWRYFELCAGTENNALCLYPPDPNSDGEWLPRTIRKIGAVMPAQVTRGVRALAPEVLHRLMPWKSLRAPDQGGWQLGSPEFLDRVRGKRTVLLTGWRMWDWNLFEKHQHRIREFLRPAKRFEETGEKFVADLRNRYETLIGVQIRQTDYRLWENGKYFFTSDQYRSFIQQLQQRFGPRAGFIVAADEVQPAGLLDGLPAHFASGAMGQSGHYMESFSELSRCDVVVTPPSTFSEWAAFCGNKPIITIRSAADDLIHAPLVPESLLARRSEAVV